MVRAGSNSRLRSTGVIATMPYIALQLVGMTAVLKALGLHGELPLAIAFIVLALYTYSAGLRAPALIAFVKDIMIYIVVITAVALIPSKLGGYANVFAAADAAFQAKGSGGLLLGGNQYVAYATLALGSALAAFMYPHTLTGIFASNSGNTIRKNAVLLPAYTLLLGLLALLGYMGHAANLKLDNANDVVPALFQTLFPSWFAGFAFAAIAIGALVPAAVMSIGAANLFTRNFWKAYVNPQVTRRRGSEGGKDNVACRQGRRAAGHHLPADAVRARSAVVGWHLDPPDLAGAGLRSLYQRFRAPALLVGWFVGFLRRHLPRLAQWLEADAADHDGRGLLHGLYRFAGAGCQCHQRNRMQCCIPGETDRAGPGVIRRMDRAALRSCAVRSASIFTTGTCIGYPAALP